MPYARGCLKGNSFELSCAKTNKKQAAARSWAKDITATTVSALSRTTCTTGKSICSACSTNEPRRPGYADILKDEQAKKPCRKFLQRGICDFGPSCRFSHMSEAEMYGLQRKMQDERRRSEGWEDPSEARPSVAAWLTTREKRRSGQASKGVQDQQEEERTQGDIPPQIFSIPDLPPSLVPPPPGGWKADGSAQWG
ncbi:zinc finger matrin-type protein 5 isoform X1 [Syngnathus scovelli]|uniref:zinc finger matrin-type protein 5 isoform X1 n=1 Tax=Syngnathus scovelli TaxID=161590 RepID=UPI0035CAD58D